MQIKKYLLGELLFLANSSPPWWRSEFYAIKDHILNLHANWEGVHLQHIVKECYGCEGSGKRMIEIPVLGELTTLPAGNCRRCNGSGKYSEFWVVLASYRLGRRHFHIPKQRYYFKDRIPDIQFNEEIEGYISHERPDYYLNSQAGYWLALIFDRKLFFERFGNVGFPSRKFTPMVILSTWIFNVKHFRAHVSSKVARLGRMIVNFQRSHCKHEFPWAEEPSVWDECKKCGIERIHTEGYYDYDGVPF